MGLIRLNRICLYSTHSYKNSSDQLWKDFKDKDFLNLCVYLYDHTLHIKGCYL